MWERGKSSINEEISIATFDCQRVSIVDGLYKARKVTWRAPRSSHDSSNFLDSKCVCGIASTSTWDNVGKTMP